MSFLITYHEELDFVNQRGCYEKLVDSREYFSFQLGCVWRIRVGPDLASESTILSLFESPVVVGSVQNYDEGSIPEVSLQSWDKSAKDTLTLHSVRFHTKAQRTCWNLRAIIPEVAEVEQRNVHLIKVAHVSMKLLAHPPIMICLIFFTAPPFIAKCLALFCASSFKFVNYCTISFFVSLLQN